MQRRTRIVATLGPATDHPGVLEGMLQGGMDVARVNFSHDSAEEHLRRIAALRRAAEGLARPVAILADLPGPKFRALLPAPLTVVAGQLVTLAASPDVSADVQLTEPEAIAAVRPGQRILLDDGRQEWHAVQNDGKQLTARVVVGGVLQLNKGVNLPDTPLTTPALVERDRQALATAAKAGVDWVALSFVRGPEAAPHLRSALRECGLDAPILAKIERPEAVGQAEAIIDAFDGIMVARGDLGVEIALERVPPVQKRLINLARVAGKPVVTATDMLDSMRTNPRPTRAEVSDVANAIYDGSDAVMLSGETAAGAYPVESVVTMDRIAREAEANCEAGYRTVEVPRADVDDHLTHTTCDLARDLNAQAIVTPTLWGRTARLVARHRPRAAVIAPTPSELVLRRLALVWGLRPVRLPADLRPGDDRIEASLKAALASRALEVGDLAVVLAGHPIEGGERLPTLRVVRVGTTGQSCTP
jgi:pyruvate kinase